MASSSSKPLHVDPAFRGGKVARAATREAFMHSALKSRYQARVFTSDNWAAERRKFMSAYNRWQGRGAKKLYKRVSFDFSEGVTHPPKVDMLAITPGPCPKAFIDELTRMAIMYAQMTGETWITGQVRQNINIGPMHDHDFALLNRTLFAPGTVLVTGGNVGTVLEGDYMFMKPNIQHCSTQHDTDAQVARISLSTYSTQFIR